jgi:hypothetical protein
LWSQFKNKSIASTIKWDYACAPKMKIELFSFISLLSVLHETVAVG